jgi:hypothetical protein
MATPTPPLIEPAIKRAVTFIDGQNLYRAAKESFGYHYPNYDVRKLSDSVCGFEVGISHKSGFTRVFPIRPTTPAGITFGLGNSR